jgi:hypothetical protein
MLGGHKTKPFRDLAAMTPSYVEIAGVDRKPIGVFQRQPEL